MKKAPDRIYLRVAPSGAIMPVIHLKPVEESQIRRCDRSRQKSIEYVRADLVKKMVESARKWSE